MTGWLEQMVEVIADRGRELLGRRGDAGAQTSTAQLCRTLLKGQGEASGIALAREILSRFQAMDADQRLEFFRLLARDFGPDLATMQTAMARYAKTEAAADLARLAVAVEPPRQELFRRLNMAPCGTVALVALRGELLRQLKAEPELKAVDVDLRHLLSSWFNRGFLRLQRIDWNSPAQTLEKLINYESVHAIHGWDDLRRRLMPDRRCFAFTHPAMPGEPLIFVEVALVQGVSDSVGELLDPDSPVLDAARADTAVFYSINNTQLGLRGISFGNFLIKQVLTELRAELPELATFVTLSPMPRFAESVRAAAAGQLQDLSRAQLAGLIEDHGDALRAASGEDDPVAGLLRPLAARGGAGEVLRAPLGSIALAYLQLRDERGHMLDPVAGFHLANGARLERINAFADPSAERQHASFGCMVNYLYDPDEVEANHEAFVASGRVALSKPLARLQRQASGTAEA